MILFGVCCLVSFCTGARLTGGCTFAYSLGYLLIYYLTFYCFLDDLGFHGVIVEQIEQTFSFINCNLQPLFFFFLSLFLLNLPTPLDASRDPGEEQANIMNPAQTRLLSIIRYATKRNEVALLALSQSIS